jgi:hypothetical protein
MIGIIALVAGVLIAGVIFHRVGNAVESRVKGVTHTPARIQTAAAAAVKVGNAAGKTVMGGYDRLPRFVAAFASTALAFVAFAVIMSIAVPPQAEFTTENVDWSSRPASYTGTVADAVLVRTTGASIENGLLYSTAVLSGQTYVSVLGCPWLATEAPGAFAALVYTIVGCFGGAMGLVIARAMEERAKRTAPAAALSL